MTTTNRSRLVLPTPAQPMRALVRLAVLAAALLFLCVTLGGALRAGDAPSPASPVGDEAPFQRGDVDGQAGISLVDAMAVIDSLMRDRALRCPDAADVGDDGRIDIGDAVLLLDHLFRGGAPPTAPFPECGTDPTPDALGCAPHEGCPVDDAAVLSVVAGRESRALPGAARRDLRGGAAGGALLALGEPVSGEILSHSQADSYLFEVDPGQWVVVDLIASTNSTGLSWTIEDAYGRELASDASGTLDDLGPVPLLGGLYSVTVLPRGTGTGAYEFRVTDATPVASVDSPLDQDVIAGEIDADHPGQRHDFEFTAAPGTTIFLDRLSSGQTNLDWWLEDARGRMLVVRGQLADRGPVALQGGAYRLSIQGRRSGGSYLGGDYEFGIRSVPPRASRAISLNTVIEDGIEVAGEEDAFTFSVGEGQIVFLDRLSPANAASFSWELTDALGRAVIARTASLADVGPRALVGGDDLVYTLRVSGDGDTTGDYSFRIVDATPTLEPYALGDEVAGEIPADRPGRVNVYGFTAPANRIVTIETLQVSNIIGLNWILEDAFGRAVLPRTGHLSTTAPISLAGGDYSLGVVGRGDATGTYRFRIRDDGPAVAPTAGAPIDIGDEIEGVIDDPGGEARYTFVADEGQTVYLDLLAADGSLDWALRDPAGTLVRATFATSTDGGDMGPYRLAAGAYTIVLSARTATATPPYGFRVADAAPVVADVAAGDVISGDFAGAPGAVHSYRFAATAGQEVFLDTLVASSRLSWSLLDPVGEPVLGLVLADRVDSDAGPFALADGVYTLVLVPQYGYEPAYEIAIRTTDVEEDALPLGSIVSGDFAGRAGSSRTVLIDVPQESTVFLDRISATDRLEWSLIDPVGQAIFGPTRLDSGAGDQGPFALGAGTHRLILDPPAGYEPAYELAIVSVDDVEAPLLFEAPLAGTVGVGATATYTFTAVEGERLLFDLAAGGSSLRWSLLDELDQPVFLDARASTGADDQGPLSLAAGDYRLVLDGTGSDSPSYELTVRRLAVDLAVSDLAVSPRVVFEGDTERAVEVTWTVENLGGGPAPTGAWTDRVVLSTDAVLGNADDIVLGEYTRFDTVRPRSSYSRRETVRLPAHLSVGQHRIYLAADADDVHSEPGGEDDNVALAEVGVVADLSPAEALFLTTTTFPFDFNALGVGQSLDLPLERPIPLESVRFLLAEGVTLQLIPRSGLTTETAVTLSLLSGREEVLEVATVRPSGGLATFAVRFSRRLSPQTIALLPNRTVDGVRFRFDQPSTADVRMRSTHADGRLSLHFAGCEFAPCGPHLERRSPGEESITIQGAETSEWRVVDFDEAVPGDDLRLVSGPKFSASVSHSIFSRGFTSSEAQLILDDGSFLTLDDSRSPSTLEAPATVASVDHSLLIAEGALAGRRIVGLRWRIHGASTLGALAVYTPQDDLAVRFLYEVEACGGVIDIPPVALEPADGAVFAPGSVVTISGRTLAPQPGRVVSAVLVNGESVDSIDASGRFFKNVRIAPGDNLFAIQVVEPGCGEPEALLRLVGLTDGVSGLSGFAEVSAQLSVEYADTSFLRVSDSVLVRARVRNESALPVRGPILMVLTDRRHPSVTLEGAAGVTEGGEPFAVLFESGTLAPGEAGAYVPLVFSNPDRLPVRYGVRWLVPDDRLPHFASVPSTTAVVGREYLYAPSAVDPDSDVVVIELERGPDGMTLEAAGAIRWTPAAGDLGSHDVAVAAVTALGRVTQRWTLTVTAASPNRPPFFATSPQTQAAVGGHYAYHAGAIDPDGDAVAFALLAGPTDMTIGAVDGVVDWPFALPGEHSITVSATDGMGGEALQSFIVAVGSLPSNPSAPRITSAPLTDARVGVLFVYQPVVSEPDGDALTFRLDEGPIEMTVDQARGRIEWTPAPGQEGTHAIDLAVEDGRGGETSQRFAVVVHEDDFNLPPVIESVPEGFALAGQLYRYDVEAIDPEGQPLGFALGAGPAGMGIDPATGAIEWVPTVGDTGSHVVSVEASDPSGAVGRQAFELRVRASNAAPRITATPSPAALVAGQVYQYDVDAEDADGDLLRYELASGPAAIDVHPITGLVTWRTTPEDVGQHAATVRVSDCCGGVAETSFSIEVVPDLTPPTLEIGFPTSPAPVGVIVKVWASASDDVAVVARTLTVECPPDAPRALALDELGRANFSSPRTGSCTFHATATDPSGNTATATATLQVGNPEDPLDPHPPVVEVLTPEPGPVITTSTYVAATVSDATEDGLPGSGPITWTVEIAPAGSDDFEELGAGEGEVENALLAVLDPTLRPNGAYRLRIVAADGVQTGGIEYDVHIAGELKLGNFTTELVDLTIPVAGIPIVITRRYDSLDTRTGEFGAGWTLGLPGRVEDTAVESRTGSGLVDLLATEPFSFGTRVSVTLADGRRVGFTFEPRSAGGLLSMFFYPHFRPDPGVSETLEVAGPPAAFFMSGGRASQVGVPYNPSKYIVTTKDGVRSTIDETTGLERIEDANGNTLEVRPDGLFSSTGVAVTFERDDEGRIARIVEPDADPADGVPPGSLAYIYDDLGNLVAFMDQAGEAVEYHYEEPAFPHYLTRVDDTLGRPVIRNAYDDQGRLVGLCGPEGDVTTLEGCTTFASDETARASTITDPRGYRTEIVLDERGNALLERRYLDDTHFVETVREYDDAGNLLSEVDPAGNVWTFTYDERGNELTRTDPLGRVRRMTYGDCSEPELTVDEAGNETRRTFDASCNVRFLEDALGNVTEYRYDEDGVLTDVIDPVGNHWSMRRDERGYPVEITDARGGTIRLEVNGAGDLVARTDQNGRRVEFEYDALHRLVREVWDTDPPTVLAYEYNSRGGLLRAADADVTLSSERDALGRVTRVERTGPSDAPAVSIEYEYDLAGNIVQVADSLGGITSYAHDGLNRLVSLTQSGAARAKRIDIDYDDASVMTELRRFADLAATASVVTTKYLFDCGVCPHGATGLHHRRSADGVEIHDIDLVRDDLGNVTRIEDAEGVHDYSYDGNRRLLDADHPLGGAQPDEFYSYDGGGNRSSSHLSARYSYGHSAGVAGNELLEDDQSVYEYDAVGNLVRSTELATGESTELAYDHRNRLTEVVRRAAGGTVATHSTYRYDPLDRRITATENGTTVHFTYDGRNPMLVLRDDGSVVSRRLYGREMDQIHADEAGGATRWFLTDHVGTVRDLVGDDASILQHYVYDSFGRVLAVADPGVENDLRFTAREYSEVTGFYHFRARNYDPSLGRFHARDPEDLFRYDYSSNSPLMFTDPTGRVTAAEYTWNSIVAFFQRYGVVAIGSVGWTTFYAWLKLINHDWGQYAGP